MDIINVQKPKREARLNVHFFALNTKKKEPPTNVSDSVFYLKLPVFQIMSLEGAFFRSYKLHRS